MVVVLVKGESEQQQFLYECRCDANIDDVACAILEVWSLQSKVQSLCLLLRQFLFADCSSREECAGAEVALERTLSEAEAYASKDQVGHKRFLSSFALRAHVDNIERAVKAVGSTSYTELNLAQHFSDSELREVMRLWWAGKELVGGKKLCDYIGTNEKTKIVIKLKPSCQGS